jgi:SAM-dependent methyltransferase
VTAHGDVEYDAAAWAAGPQLVYDRLAERAVSLLPADLTGRHAIDVGAGTGALTRALLRRGARVDAADLSAEMMAELRRQTKGRVATTVAEIRALPMESATYDIAGAAFVVNHLSDPHLAVAELARVTRPDGCLLATSFGEADPPAKLAIDAVLRGHGYTPPSWYFEMKAQTMPLTATTSAFGSVTRAAGLSSFDVVELDVDFSDLTPEAVAAYRLGMAHTAPFVSALSADARKQLTSDAIEAVASSATPLALLLLALVAGVSGPGWRQVDRATAGSRQTDARDVGGV